jgi:FtsZ-interacting cell division protein YlmF
LELEEGGGEGEEGEEEEEEEEQQQQQQQQQLQQQQEEEEEEEGRCTHIHSNSPVVSSNVPSCPARDARIEKSRDSSQSPALSAA